MRILALLTLSAIATSEAATPTFNRDIAPILYKNCAACHRPGEAAPFPLLTYQDAFVKKATLAKAVHNRAMPPWKAEQVSFPYRDERRISEKEIALIEEWVKAGAPEGAPEDKPTPPTFAGGWRLGEPDLVIEMPRAFNVPADGPDIYRNIAVPLGIAEDKWITAIDMRPSARAAVHHVLYFADPKGKAHEKQQGDQPGFNGMRAGGSTVALGGWAVGSQPSFFPENLALKVPKNSDLVIQYHFHPTGKPEAEKSLIGIYFAKEEPKRLMTRIQMPPHYALFSGLDIPAGEKDFVIKDTYTLPVAIDAVGVSSHAHYIAKQMKMTATLPGGETKTLFHIKDWDFAWQDRYYFEKFQPFPEGTRLDVEIHWDNSAENPRNPSAPPVRVQWGEQTKDEMGSISLIAVAQKESDRATLRKHISERENKVVRKKMEEDPLLAFKVMQMMSE
jgi:hypothetical protein